MSQQKRVEFKLEEQISLIPIYCRGQESKKKKAIIDDPKAIEIVDSLDYDFKELNIPKQTHLTICLRAKQIDNYINDFLREKSNTAIVQLGCGMSTRAERIAGYDIWYDIDSPDIIKFREKNYQNRDNYQMLATEVLNFNWIKDLAVDKNYLFIAEGLLMHLKEEEVKDLVLKLQESFREAKLIFDAYNKATVTKINKYHNQTGLGTKIAWGLNNGTELESWHEEIKLIEQWEFSDSKDIKKLFIFYRLLFKVAGLISSIKESHRLFYYQL